MPGFEWIDEEEKNAVSSIFDNGGVLFAHGFDGMRNGVYHVREFEQAVSDKFNAKHCQAVTSGTAATKVALKAVGVKPGDEVITQAFNFIATVEAILDCGATPVIANVDNSLNMDPSELASLVSPKTSAIVPVHMLGVPADMDPIMAFAKDKGLPVVEDNCESVGARYDGVYLGTIGEAGVFSFDHGKIIATGEGGMVLCNDPAIFKYANEYQDHGHENNPALPRGLDTCSNPGFNYRMTEMQAAVGKVQLSKLDRMLEANRLRYQALQNAMGDLFDYREVPVKCEIIHDCLIFFENDPEKRKSYIAFLNEQGFGTKNLPDAINWHCAAYWQHALSDDQVQRVQPTKDLLSTAIAIPMWRRKSEEQYSELGKCLQNFPST
jgi:8-amino-3,8-dideoxy-alpha-D-manno-octulosonate transaminase